MRLLRVLLCLALLAALHLPVSAAPRYVTWTAQLQPAGVRAGEGAQVVVTAKITSGWHLYSLSQPDGGPVKTTLNVEPGSALVSAGTPVQPKPTKQHDAGFNMTIEIFQGTVSFGIPVKIKPGTTGATVAKLQVRYQLCNASMCLPPKTEEISIPITVAAGTVRAGHEKPVTVLPKKTASIRRLIDRRLILAGGPSLSTGSSKDAYSNAIAHAQSQGLLAFLGFSFAAGLLALLTPCVFPMIPITVSFFTKRRGAEPARGIRDAVAYCVGIVGTFTGVGMFVALVFGASGIAKFATNPITNLFLAVLFLVLAANLLGAFEVALPSELTNKFQSGTRSGGLLAPVLMGLTFTMTSFTCTAPFVGTLLVTATRGNVFFPLVGMLAFSTAFALPFFLLALFPQYLARLPKSGAWLVSVKAFMGLLEIAAALKFLSNADLVWQRGILTRPIFLSVWAMIACIGGLYLLGWVRFPHDMDTVKVGWIRRLIGVGSFFAAFYCLAAIEGAPLGELDSFVPPSPYPGRGLTTVAEKGGESPANASVHAWLSDYSTALAQAKAENKPLLINFTGVTCTNCRWMEKNVFPKPEVVQETDKYVKVELYTDRGTPADDANQKLEEKLTNEVTLPVYVALSPDGKVRKVFQGLTRKTSEFVTFLQQGQAMETASL